MCKFSPLAGPCRTRTGAAPTTSGGTSPCEMEQQELRNKIEECLERQKELLEELIAEYRDMEGDPDKEAFEEDEDGEDVSN